MSDEKKFQISISPEAAAIIARFERGEFTPEEQARFDEHEARINKILRKAAREHDLLLAWSKVYGANKIYR